MESKNKGFIKLPRTILDWQWYDDINVLKLMIHLMIKANFQKKQWRGITIYPKQFITSYDKLSAETGLTVSKVRTALKKLIVSKDIKVTPKSKFSIIEIKALFFVDTQDHNQIAVKSHSNSNQIATTKNDKEIEKNKKEFKEEVFSLTNYSKNILNEFYKYWSEKNKTTGRLKFQDKEYWETKIRIERWAAKEKSQSNNQPQDINR